MFLIPSFIGLALGFALVLLIRHSNNSGRQPPIPRPEHMPPISQIGRATLWSPSSRPDPFRVGHRYVVLTFAKAHPPAESLIAGEDLIYEGSGYSRYDGQSIYSFVTTDGQARSWQLHDDDPVEGWQEIFAEQ